MLCGVFGGDGLFGEVYLGVGQLHLGSTSKIGRLVPSLVLVFKTNPKLGTSFRLALRWLLPFIGTSLLIQVPVLVQVLGETMLFGTKFWVKRHEVSSFVLIVSWTRVMTQKKMGLCPGKMGLCPGQKQFSPNVVRALVGHQRFFPHGVKHLHV